jgi:hypothetical protein
MSRGQMPRTPEYFPRMKHRAAGRIARRELDETYAAYTEWTRAVGAAMQPMVDALRAMGSAALRIVDRYFRIRGRILYVRDDIGEQWRAELARVPGSGWSMIPNSARHTVTDEQIAMWGDRAAFRRVQMHTAFREVLALRTAAALDRSIMRVPHVDLDIQGDVDLMRPSTLGQRVAIERTLQDRRDRLR